MISQEELLIVTQILLVITIGNLLRTIWRICILIQGCKGLLISKHNFKQIPGLEINMSLKSIRV